MYSTKTYPTESPTPLWRTFTQIHEERDKINSRLVELIAEDVQEQSNGDLDPEVEAQIERILGGEDGV